MMAALVNTEATLTMASPVGPIVLRAGERGLAAVYLVGMGEPLASRDGGGGQPVLLEARRQLDDYFARKRTTFDVPLDPGGTTFQREVWAVLREIPYGETWSYRRVAEALGRPSATRAVGAANGQNPVAIIVPCHRVIGADGSLTGYAGGLAIKRWLLAHETGQRSLLVQTSVSRGLPLEKP
jgi:methylated-DNA-[protein]-cysteine S-methyltransferase